MRPVELVVIVRDDDLGSACPGRGDRGPRATVVKDGSHAWEQPCMVHIPNREAILTGFAQGEIRPSFGKDRAQSQGSSGFDKHMRGLIGGAHAAKAQENGGSAFGEKIFQFLRQGRLIC